MKAMILAAGKGTRLLPITENKPKALIEIQGITLLEHTIRYLNYYGVNEIIINIHHHADQIVDFILKNDHFGIHVEFSDETDELLDTGGGLYKARSFFNDKEPFFLTTSDVITDLNLSELYQYHKDNRALVTLAVKHRNSSRDFLFDADSRLCGWHNNLTGESRIIRNVNDPVKLGFSGIHVLDPSVFDLIIERGCFSIIDLYLRLASEHPVVGFEHANSDWFECGRIASLDDLNQRKEIQTIYKKYHNQSGIL